MKVYNFLQPSLVITDLSGKSRDKVLEEMVCYLKKNKLIYKEKELLAKLIQREKLGSTAIGEGVAVPHCKIKGLKAPVVLLGLSRRGVDFHSLDGKPTHLFFLVISSAENPSLNLQILAAIAHLIRKSNNLVKKTKELSNPQDILEVIRKEEDKVDEG